MSILPQSVIDELEEKEEKEEELPLLKEFGVDFSTSQLTGQIVEGIEAIRVWLWLLFNTDRYIHVCLPWDVGNELRTLINDEDSNDQEYLQSVGEEMVKDALSINEYITDVTTEIKKQNDKLLINLSVSTVYGQIGGEYSV